MANNLEIIPGPTPLSIYHRGPPKDQGALPALFYFALSGEDSLNLTPFNQPIDFLDQSPIRCFSFTLPGHGIDLKNSDALAHWAKEFRQGHDPLVQFLNHASENLRFLINENWIDAAKIAAVGLSRGGLIAALFALMDQRIATILAFAPLTQLAQCSEFQALDLAEVAEKYSLTALADELTHKTIRFYIGNCDQRVSTDSCYQTLRTIADHAYKKGLRSPKVEMVISASTGHLGHGTPPHIFLEGVNWLKTHWEL